MVGSRFSVRQVQKDFPVYEEKFDESALVDIEWKIGEENIQILDSDLNSHPVAFNDVAKYRLPIGQDVFSIFVDNAYISTDDGFEIVVLQILSTTDYPLSWWNVMEGIIQWHNTTSQTPLNYGDRIYFEGVHKVGIHHNKPVYCIKWGS